MSAPTSFPNLLEALINRLLRLDTDTLNRLGELEGKVIGLRVTPPDQGEPLVHYVLPAATGLQLCAEPPTDPDVVITGNVPVFAQLMFGEMAPAAAGAELQISGDVELGQRFKRIIERIDIDWEERAAHTLGDVAAHKLGNLVRNLRVWVDHAGSTLGADAREYLQEESRILAKRERVEAFLSAVDILRADADRLEKRIERLQGMT